MSIVKYTAGSLMWVYFFTKSKLDHLC